MPNWTEAQLDTIDSRSENILVSAAAGSGKTAVLVERIKQLVIRDHVDIDRFLITTFTNAAAAEMRQRLEKTITEELECGAEGDDRVFLKRQLHMLPSASISTFHAFAINLIKEYFYLTDLEPGFQIGDEVQVKIMCDDAVSKVFERRFEEDFEDFTDFLSRHSSDRNDRNLKAAIVTTIKSMKSIPHYMEWARHRVDLMNRENPIEEFGIDRLIDEQIKLAFNIAEKRCEEVLDILECEGLEGLYDKASCDMDAIKKVANEPSYENARDFIKGYKFVTLSAKKDEKESYAAVKDRIKKLRDSAKSAIKELEDNFFQMSIDDYIKDIKDCYDDTKFFLNLIEECETALKSMKQDIGIVDFDDIMHYAIEILENRDVADEVRERYEYIFVDEYQDSNALQETIIQNIARDNNLFMVGDVKQSIYKFRLAEPEIFMNTARRYGNENIKNSRVINLNDNFRSKESVTSAVNAVFKAVMPGYNDDVALHCNIDDPGHDTALRIVSKGELEPVLVSKLIKEYVGTDYYDWQSEENRKISFSDIAVLSRSGSNVATIEHYLNNEGIPAYGETGEGYFESVEIQAFMNILRVIDNLRQDIPLISAMRTVVFDFTIEEMAQIRANDKENAYYQAVLNYAEEGSRTDLRQKVKNMLDKIRYWKELSRNLPLEELVRTVLYDTGYYDYCSGLPVGGQRTANLRLIVEKASKYEITNFSGLYGFIKYIDAMENSQVSEAEAKVISEGADVVRVMTVHKSKGLEFPIVILVGAGKSIKSVKKSAIGIHKDFGIGLKKVNKEEKWHRKTLIQRAIEKTMSSENSDEEVRILYVAMTRAKDRLEIIGTVKDTEKLPDVPERTSYIDMIYPIVRTMDNIVLSIYPEDVSVESEDVKGNSSFEILMETTSDVNVSAEMETRLGYNYPRPKEIAKSKYSVSELNRGQVDVPIHIEDLNSRLMKSELSISAVDEGTAMHLIMEKIDFSRVLEGGIEYVSQVADKLLDSESITAASRDAIVEGNIIKFFKHDVGKRAAMASKRGKLYREQEFVYNKEINGTMAVIQGVIDCYFIEDDHIVLVDYKNSYMSPNRTIDDIKDIYGNQIELYKEALEGATGLKVTESYLYLFKDTFHKI